MLKGAVQKSIQLILSRFALNADEPSALPQKGSADLKLGHYRKAR